jgi:hypothetical protein
MIELEQLHQAAQSRALTLETQYEAAHSRAAEVAQQHQALRVDFDALQKASQEKEVMLTQKFEDGYVELRRSQQAEKQRADQEAANALIFQKEKEELLQEISILQQQSAQQQSVGMSTLTELEQRASIAEEQARQTQDLMEEQSKLSQAAFQQSLRISEEQRDQSLAQANALQEEVMLLKQEKEHLQAEQAYLMKELEQKPRIESNPSEQILIKQLTEENSDLKEQLARTWAKINEQTKKIEEERAAFWEELETVRLRGESSKATQSSTVFVEADVPRIDPYIQPRPANISPIQQSPPTTSQRPVASVSTNSQRKPASNYQTTLPATLPSREVPSPSALSSQVKAPVRNHLPTASAPSRTLPARGQLSTESRTLTAAAVSSSRAGLPTRAGLGQSQFSSPTIQKMGISTRPGVV